MISASSATLSVFQSPERRPGGAGASGAIGTGRVMAAPPVPAPPRAGPPARAPVAAVGAGAGGGAERMNGVTARSGSRAVSRPIASSVTRNTASSPALSATYTPVIPASVFSARKSTPVRHSPSFASSGQAAEPREKVQILIRRIEHEPSAARARRDPDQLAVLCLPLRRAERVPARERGTGERRVRPELMCRPLRADPHGGQCHDGDR